MTANPPLGDLARHAAFAALARQARVWPEFQPDAIEGAVEAVLGRGANTRDEAFARAIYFGAISRWITISYLIERAASRPVDTLEPRVIAAMAGGAAQVLFLDRVPVHAAINHAVEWAKAAASPRAGGIVNAVLRRIAELRGSEGEDRRIRERFGWTRDELPTGGDSAGSIVLSSQVLPEDEVSALCVATSHPRGLIEHWLRTRSLREVKDLTLHSLASPPTVLNTAYAGAPLPNSLRAHSSAGAAVFAGVHGELRALLESRSDLWVQDTASAKAIESVGDLKPGLIVDLCAGQGTKTRQLTAAFPQAIVYATDVDEARYARLKAAFAGSDRVKVEPFELLRRNLVGRADLVLLDVPCSNTGVLARRPEARYRFGKKTLDSVTGVQRQIIADAIPLLAERPRGKILYSTCSLETEENQAQVQWAIKWHGFNSHRTSATMPRGSPGDDAAGYSDGAFSSLLEG